MLRYRKLYAYHKLSQTEKGTVILIDTNEKSLYTEKLTIIKQIYDKSEPITNSEKSFILNHCRYILENISTFFYPNCDEPLVMLQKQILEEHVVSKSKTIKLFAAIQMGSHSLLDSSLDHEDIEDDNDFKIICSATIHIVKKFCGKQLMNLNT
jgi:hypothetical protein